MAQAEMSVVVTTVGQRVDLLDHCVARLLEDDAAREVIVVNDGGPPIRLAQEFAERLRLIELPSNRGQALARKAGVEAAHADLVLSVDDDVVVERGHVTRHLRHHHECIDGRLIVVGYVPVALGPSAASTAERLYARRYDETCDRYDTDPGLILRRLWGGGCVSFRRSIYLEVCGFLDGRIRYHEDKDLGLLLRAAGCRAVFDRLADGRHFYRRSDWGYVMEGRGSGSALVLIDLRQGLGAGRVRRLDKVVSALSPWAVRVATAALFGVSVTARTLRAPGAHLTFLELARRLQEATGRGMTAREARNAAVGDDIHTVVPPVTFRPTR
jgi:GT2 family glycosyltransferase